ncbi:MAG: primase-helicase family protein, partial [Bacteroidota bacterium]
PDAHIRDLARQHLRQQKNKRPLAALLRGGNIYLGSDKLEAVLPFKPNFQRDTKEAAYYYYKNGFVEVTADDIAFKPYDDLKGFIWDDWILDRPINLESGGDDWLDCEFGALMRLVTAGDTARMSALLSAVGYLLHGHKNPGNARAIIFTEEKISDDPSGGTGKGLIAQGIGKLVKSAEIDSRRLKLEAQFAFQSIVPGVTRVVHFDDAGPRFQFDYLYPSITGVMTVERKNQQAIPIPFSDSPKFVITTNEVLRGRGGSHERRIFEIEFADYFNENHTPEQEFGHRLFDDWDAKEWSRFDRLMLYSVQHYLQNGLVWYRYVNLDWKKVIKNTSPEFGDFVQVFGFEANPPGTLAPNQTRYEKPALVETFIREHKKDLTPHMLTTWLMVYAKYRGWELLNQLGKGKKE